MAEVCDYTIIGAGNVTIGDNGPEFVETFNTGSTLHNRQSLIMLQVYGLTDSFAVVEINGRFQKALQPAVNSNQWFAQHMVVPGGTLSPVNENELRIHRVRETGGGGGSFDDFIVRDIVLFFKQNAG